MDIATVTSVETFVLSVFVPLKGGLMEAYKRLRDIPTEKASLAERESH